MFKNTNRIIRFSDFGHGKTVSGKNSILGYEIINHLTTQYPDEKFVLVGLSWGAMLCVDFTLNYPHKVEKLILVSPGLNGWTYFKDSLTFKNYTLRQTAIDHSDTLEAAKLFHKNWVVGPSRQDNELDESFYSQSLDLSNRNSRHGSGTLSLLDLCSHPVSSTESHIKCSGKTSYSFRTIP